MSVQNVVFPVNALWIKVRQMHVDIVLSDRHSQLFCVGVIKAVWKTKIIIRAYIENTIEKLILKIHNTYQLVKNTYGL